METGNFLGQCVSKTPSLDGGKGSETSSAFKGSRRFKKVQFF